MRSLYGLYVHPEGAQRAVDALRAAGVDDASIEVVSSEPWDHYEFGRREHHTVMPWLAALGGLLGGAAGFLLSMLTQRAYPLPTGSMPIFAVWPTGIVTYEMTMLGAILASVLTLALTAGLPSWKARLYDPEIADGKILVGVRNPSPDSRIELERRLKEAGARSVREFGAAESDFQAAQTEGGNA
jgi:hypothetical protein